MVRAQRRSQRPRCLRSGSVAASFLGLWVRIPPPTWMSVSVECCPFSCRDLCFVLITLPKESYRVWSVWVWTWSQIMRRPWPTRGYCIMEQKKLLHIGSGSYAYSQIQSLRGVYFSYEQDLVTASCPYNERTSKAGDLTTDSTRIVSSCYKH